MHRIQIPSEKIDFEIPSRIEELTQSQYVCFVDLLLRFQKNLITIEEFRVALISKLMDLRINWKYFCYCEEKKEAINTRVYQLSELIESFFQYEERNSKLVKVLQLSFVKNFIPKILGKYYGPDDALVNLTFYEYRIAHGYFHEYLKNDDEDALNRFIAVIYRRRKPFLWILKHLPWYDGEQRRHISSKSNPIYLKNRVKDIEKLSMAIRYGIFLYWSGCEEFLATGQPVIDGTKIDLSILFSKTPDQGNSNGIGLVGLLYTLSEGKVFGDIRETDDQNLFDVLVKLYQDTIKMQEVRK